MHSCVVTKITVIMHAVKHQRSDHSDTREEQKVQLTKMARQQPTILSQHQIVINI